jgi:hypothetical protein
LAVVDLAYPVALARKEEHALGDRGLAGVNVGHEPYVSGPANVEILGHASVFLSLLERIRVNYTPAQANATADIAAAR